MRQLEEKISGAKTGTTFVIEYTDSTFGTVDTRSKQMEEKNTTQETQTGDCVKVFSDMGAGFTVTTGVTKFMRQLEEKISGAKTGTTFGIEYTDSTFGT